MHLRRCLTLLLPLAMLLASGCGGTDIKVAKSDPLHRGAEIFNQRCGGCHTLDAASTEGSASKPKDKEYKDGPNFDQRKEQFPDVVYAIQNGGFSSGPMPQNIVTGKDARIVACFVATYSGDDAVNPPSPGNQVQKSSPCRDQLDVPTR